MEQQTATGEREERNLQFTSSVPIPYVSPAVWAMMDPSMLAPSLSIEALENNLGVCQSLHLDPPLHPHMTQRDSLSNNLFICRFSTQFEYQ